MQMKVKYILNNDILSLTNADGTCLAGAVPHAEMP